MGNWFTRLFYTDPREEIHVKVRVREDGKNSFIIEEKFRSLDWKRVRTSSYQDIKYSYKNQEEAEKAARRYFEKENKYWQEYYGNQEDRKRNRKVVKLYE